MRHAKGRASTLTLHVDRLIRNTRAVAARLSPGTRLLAVVKANAYGHGLEATSGMLEPLPEVAAFGVSALWEAAVLRQHRVQKPILILGPTANEHFPRAATEGLSLTIHQPLQVPELIQFARTASAATLHLPYRLQG